MTSTDIILKMFFFFLETFFFVFLFSITDTSGYEIDEGRVGALKIITFKKGDCFVKMGFLCFFFLNKEGKAVRINRDTESGIRLLRVSRFASKAKEEEEREEEDEE